MIHLLLPLLTAIVIVFIAMSHLSWRQGAVWLSLSSLLLFMLISLMVLAVSQHKCDQGSAPGYLTIVTGVLGALVPWFRKIGIWYRRVLVATLVFVGMRTAMILTSSYHGEKITGNPQYSDGRFWHTPLSGQYPRSIASGDLQKNKLKHEMELLEEMQHSNTDATEQDGGGQPATRPESK